MPAHIPTPKTHHVQTLMPSDDLTPGARRAIQTPHMHVGPRKSPASSRCPCITNLPDAGQPPTSQLHYEPECTLAPGKGAGAVEGHIVVGM